MQIVIETIKIIKNFRDYIRTLDLNEEELKVIIKYHSSFYSTNYYINLISISDLIEYSTDDLEHKSQLDQETYDKIIKSFNKLLFLCDRELFISSEDENIWKQPF